MNKLFILNNKNNLEDFRNTKFGGYVYILKDEHRIKIGRTSNPYKRINAIRSQSGIELQKICLTPVIYNYASIETYMHRSFKFQRGIGEWFETSFNSAIAFLLNLPFELATKEQDETLEVEYKRKIKESIRAFSQKLEISYREELYGKNKSVERGFHCKYCYCPVSEFRKNLTTYIGDECKLYSIFLSILEFFEDRNTPFNYCELLELCRYEFKEFTFKDIEVTLNELIDIQKDLSAMPNNYVEQLINFIPSLNKKED